MFILSRFEHNPIISPHRDHPWESVATFNGCPIVQGGTIHIFYRAISSPDKIRDKNLNVSTVGHSVSTDNIHFQNHQRIIYPQYDWEKYGCEDPRVTKLDDTYYIFYTALSEFPFRAEGIKAAVATTKDLTTIDQKHLVTPFNAKAMTIFPERINGKIVVVFTLHPDVKPAQIAFAELDTPEQLWDENFWDNWYKNRDGQFIDPRRSDTDHVEVGAPPVKTEHGWLFVYSHIQNYFSHDKIFGIEVLLLDLDDPKKVIGRTRGPLMIPQEIHERYGLIPNIVFPSGALVRDDTLEIYYGATDTTCCKASVNLEHIIEALQDDKRRAFAERYNKNPILEPIKENSWESKAVFNAAALDIDGVVHIVYRAMSDDNTSVMGLATSKNGVDIDERLPEQIYVPREQFEMKLSSPTGNSGCEDPRLTLIDDTIYMCYTAYNGVNPPRVALSSISKSDFLARKWTWTPPVLITPEHIDNKDACILPRKFKDGYMLMHRVDHQICADYLTEPIGSEPVTRCLEIFGPRPGMWDGVKVGIAGPPLETPEGWLLLYHGVSSRSTYRVGAALLDKDDPTIVIARTVDPIFEPLEEYEVHGQVGKVVFPCGAVRRDDTIFMYYGGGDSVLGVATISYPKLLDILTWKGEHELESNND